MSDSDTLRLRMRHHRGKLIEILDCEFGLLNIILKNRVLSRSEIRVIKCEPTSDRKNEMLLFYIDENGKHDDFMAALEESSQTHVVNWIIADGKYEDRFGMEWPLKDRENGILDDNQTTLVEFLNTYDLLNRMYSEGIINRWHREFIESKPTNLDKNEALLEIVVRLSLKTYYKLIKCLRDSNQGHVADILEFGGAIVPVHVTSESDNLNEAETQLVTKMHDLLRSNTTTMEQEDRVLAALELKVIAVRRGESIVLYIRCCKETELTYLCKIVNNMRMKETLGTLFNLFLDRLKIRILVVKIFETDLAKAKETFARIAEQLSASTSNFWDNADNLIEKPEELTIENEDYLRDSGESVDVNCTTTYKNTVFRNIGKVIWKVSEIPRDFEGCAFVICANDGVTFSKNFIKINLNRPGDVSYMPPIPSRMQFGVAAAVHSNSIFVTGAGDNYDEILKFDSASFKWKKCASLIQGRQYHSVAFVDHILYICGGYVKFSGKTLDDVEAHNEKSDRHISVGKLAYAVRCSGNCVPFKASLYIFGGCDDNYRAVSNVQIYNTRLNVCTVLATPMPRADCFLRAVIWENTVILLGLTAGFLYCFDTGCWQAKDQFQTGDIRFGLITDKDKLFFIGGVLNWASSQKNDIKWMPVVKILNDKSIEWKQFTKLPSPSDVYELVC